MLVMMLNFNNVQHDEKRILAERIWESVDLTWLSQSSWKSGRLGANECKTWVIQ